MECPHCGEPTLPNRLADGGTVCSCAAGRALLPPPNDPAPPPVSAREPGTVSPFPHRPR